MTFLSCCSRPRAALIYFGVVRSIRFTYDSHQRFLLEPLAKLFDLSVLGFFVQQETISSSKTGEFTVIDYASMSLLGITASRLIPINDVLISEISSSVKSFGDSGWDNFYSTENLIRQLITLDAAASFAALQDHEVVFFCRTDLLIHECILDCATINLALSSSCKDIVYLPYWGAWSGYNDRLALCVGKRSIRAYGQRISLLQEFCTKMSAPLHAERLLAYSLNKFSVSIRPLKITATRVRETGRLKTESFAHQNLYFRYLLFAMVAPLRRMKMHALKSFLPKKLCQ